MSASSGAYPVGSLVAVWGFPFRARTSFDSVDFTTVASPGAGTARLADVFLAICHSPSIDHSRVREGSSSVFYAAAMARRGVIGTCPMIQRGSGECHFEDDVCHSMGCLGTSGR